MDNLQDHLNKNPELEKKLKDMAIGKEEIDFIEDINLPNVSILMPTYNRRHFLPLIMVNLHNMDYPKNKLELVIYDDHISPLFINNEEVKIFESKCGIKTNYIYNNLRHLTIGEKRNKLVKLSKYKILINMDDDDIYFPQYIKYSIHMLKHYKAGIVGSPEMLFTYPHYDFITTGIKCSSKRQIHEATFCFTKGHWKSMGGFMKKGVGEGAKMVDFNEKNCIKSDIINCMCCVAHKENTVDKEIFKDKNKDWIDLVIPDIYQELLKDILDLP